NIALAGLASGMTVLIGAEYGRGVHDAPPGCAWKHRHEKYVWTPVGFTTSPLHGLVQSYHPSGNLQELAFMGTDGQLVTMRRMGAAGRTFRYDARGNLVESTFFDLHRQPATSRLRGLGLAFARQTVEWDEHGGTLETYFSPDGKPIVIQGRFVTLRAVFDARG